jgi:outer membrane immunogenic protein
VNWVAELKKLLVAALGLAALGIAPARAADLPVQAYKTPVMIPAYYDWSGFYLGLNGGGATSRECWTVTVDGATPVTPNSEGCHNATGAVAGGQLGYRLQSAGWVFGVELQGDWAGLRGSNASSRVIIPATDQTSVDAFGLLTGQVGYAFNKVLWYVKGGGAVTDNRYSISFISNGVPYNQASETRWGGTAGTGLEVSFAPDWSVAFEYDHLFMGNRSVVFTPTPAAVGRTDTISQSVDVGTVKINYRWGGPVLSKY